MRLQAFSASTFALCASLITPAAVAGAAPQDPGATRPRPPSQLRLREEVTVTADRLEVPVDESGSSVTIITAAQLRASGVQWLADALAAVPGVTVTRSGGPGAATSVFLRGANSSHTLVLMDGVKLNTPSTGAYDLSKIPASAVERVEIVRGAQSVLYGSEAVGGVINIVTATGEGAAQANLVVEGGSYSTRRVAGRFRGSANDIRFAAGFERFGTDGYSGADAANGNHEADRFGNTAIDARIAVGSAAGFSAEAQLLYFDGVTGIDGYDFVDGPVDDLNQVQDSRELTGKVEATYRKGVYTGRLRVSRVDQVLGTVDPDGAFSTATDLDAGITAFELQNDLRFNADNTTTVGIERRHEGAASSSASPFGSSGFDEQIDVTGLFALHRIAVADRVHLSAGARFTDHSRFGSKTTYRATAAWAAPAGLRAHGSVGTGFRAPSLNDLYYPGFSNPRLAPEESTGWELGAGRAFLDGRLTIDATWFHNHIENLIAYVFPAGLVNFGSVRSRGLETSVYWRASDRVQLEGNHTFTDAIDLGTDEQLLRRPRHQGSLAAHVQATPALRGFIELRHKGSRSDFGTAGVEVLPAYTILNLANQLRVSRSIEFIARIDNLTDHGYQDVWGYGTAGLSGYVGLRYDWAGR